MKKTLIISLVLILVAGGIFGVSLYHYMGTTKTAGSTPSQTAAKGNTGATVETQAASTENSSTKMPEGWNDNGIFSSYYDKAYQRVLEMTDEELTGSVIMGVCQYDDDDALTDVTKYKLGAYLMESACFSGVSEDEIKEMIKKYKQRYDGFFIAVDEEGGSNTTVTDHNAFTQYSFDAVGDIYREGGITEVQKMERDKLAILKECGITLNLAPVVDLATEMNHVMYTRSLGADAKTTSDYAKYVTSTFQADDVSVCLRHFPGYGTIEDSYDSPLKDERLLKDLQTQDFLPFEAGIEEKCHFIMISNVLVQALDPTNVASLSANAHKTLRNDLGFSGIILSENIDDLPDTLAQASTEPTTATENLYGDENSYSSSSLSSDPYGQNEQQNTTLSSMAPLYVQAVTAGNDMILVNNYGDAFDSILQALQNGSLKKETLQKAATRVLAYKYTVGLIKDKKIG